MVKKYGNGEGMFHANAVYVSLEDYLALQAALREALGGWETDADRDYKFDKRISELRAQFLADK